MSGSTRVTQVQGASKNKELYGEKWLFLKPKIMKKIEIKNPLELIYRYLMVDCVAALFSLSWLKPVKWLRNCKRTKKQSTEDRLIPFYSNFFYIFCFWKQSFSPYKSLYLEAVMQHRPATFMFRAYAKFKNCVSTWAKNSNVRLKTWL